MTTAEPPFTLDSLDVTDNQLYSGPRGMPWAEWDFLRTTAPIFRYERDGYDPHWALTRHADILTVSKRSDIFTQERTLRVHPSDAHHAMIAQRIADEEALGRVEAAPSNFVDMDEPHHSKYRSIVSKWFTPRANDARMPLLEQTGREALARFEAELASEKHGAGVADIVDTVGMYVPMAIILTMLGIPREMQEPLYYEVDSGLSEGDRSFRNRHRETDVGETFSVLGQAVQHLRQKEPKGDSIIEHLLTIQVDGKPISDKQIMGMLGLLVVAGLETTRNAITGGIHALLHNPDQLQLLLDDPSDEVIASTTEEVLRWTSPILHFARTATKDFELSGQTIKAGEDVVMWYPAANRDPEVFADPYTFDITRDPNDHLTFGGYGAHHCLGANLARWEIRMAIKQLVPYFPRLEIVEEPKRFAGMGIHVTGFEEFLVRVRE